MSVNLRLLWLTARYAPGRGGMAVSCDRAVHALRRRGAWIDLVHLSRAATQASYAPRENGSERVLPAGDEAPHELAALWPQLEAHSTRTGGGWTHVVAFLIDRGAKVDVVDVLGKSPLDVALNRVGGRTAPNAEAVAALLRNANGTTVN